AAKNTKIERYRGQRLGRDSTDRPDGTNTECVVDSGARSSPGRGRSCSLMVGDFGTLSLLVFARAERRRDEPLADGAGGWPRPSRGVSARPGRGFDSRGG